MDGAMAIMLLSLLSFLLRKTDLAPRLVGFSFFILPMLYYPAERFRLKAVNSHITSSYFPPDMLRL